MPTPNAARRLAREWVPAAAWFLGAVPPQRLAVEEWVAAWVPAGVRDPAKAWILAAAPGAAPDRDAAWALAVASQWAAACLRSWD